MLSFSKIRRQTFILFLALSVYLFHTHVVNSFPTNTELSDYRLGLIGPFQNHAEGVCRMMSIMLALYDISVGHAGVVEMIDNFGGFKIPLVLKNSRGLPLDAVGELVDMIYNPQYAPEKLLLVLGPNNSGAALSAAQLLYKLRIADISWAATSGSLSLKTMYPYFFRTVPSDQISARGIDVMLKANDWWQFVILHDSSDYSSGLATSTIAAVNARYNLALDAWEAAGSVGSAPMAPRIRVLSFQSSPGDPHVDQISDQLDVIYNAVEKYRVVICFTTAVESLPIFEIAYAKDMLRPGWVWIVGDSVANGAQIGSPTEPGFAERAILFKGVLGIRPISQGPRYTQFRDRWTEQITDIWQHEWADGTIANDPTHYLHEYHNFVNTVRATCTSAYCPTATGLSAAQWADGCGYGPQAYDAAVLSVCGILSAFHKKDLDSTATVSADMVYSGLKDLTFLNPNGDLVDCDGFEGVSAPISLDGNGDASPYYEFVSYTGYHRNPVQVATWNEAGGLILTGEPEWPGDGAAKGWENKPSGNEPSCSVGYMVDVITNKCVKCPAGTFGYLDLGNGQGLCDVCADGLYSNEEGRVNQCLPCPAGRARSVELDDLYGTTPGTECHPCTEGTFANTLRSSKCTECGVGTFANTIAQDKCDPCPLGTYMDRIGGTACVACPGGRTTFNVGSDSVSLCVCPSGTFEDDERVCKECPDHTYCDTANTTRPIIAAGYWTDYVEPGVPINSLSIYKCIDPDVCPGGEFGSCVGYRAGIACGRCPSGFYSEGLECRSCEGATTAGVIILLVCLLFSGFCVVHLFATGRVTRVADPIDGVATLIIIFVNSLQALGVLAGIKVSWPTIVTWSETIVNLDFLTVPILSLECAYHTSFMLTYMTSALIPIIIVLCAAILWLLSQVLYKPVQYWILSTYPFLERPMLRAKRFEAQELGLTFDDIQNKLDDSNSQSGCPESQDRDDGDISCITDSTNNQNDSASQHDVDVNTSVNSPRSPKVRMFGPNSFFNAPVPRLTAMAMANKQERRKSIDEWDLNLTGDPVVFSSAVVAEQVPQLDDFAATSVRSRRSTALQPKSFDENEEEGRVGGSNRLDALGRYETRSDGESDDVCMYNLNDDYVTRLEDAPSHTAPGTSHSNKHNGLQPLPPKQALFMSVPNTDLDQSDVVYSIQVPTHGQVNNTSNSGSNPSIKNESNENNNRSTGSNSHNTPNDEVNVRRVSQIEDSNGNIVAPILRMPTVEVKNPDYVRQPSLRPMRSLVAFDEGNLHETSKRVTKGKSDDEDSDAERSFTKESALTMHTYETEEKSKKGMNQFWRFILMRLLAGPVTWNRLINSCGLLICLLFISTITGAFSLFDCYSHPNGKRSVKSRADILCREGVWNTALPIGIIILVIYLGALYLGQVWIVYRAPVLSKQQSYIVRYGFMYQGTRSDRYWWHAANLTRDLVVSCSGVLGSDYPGIQICVYGFAMLVGVLVQSRYWPWSNELNNYDDLVINSTLLLILILASAFKLTDQFPGGDVIIIFLYIVIVMWATYIAVSFFVHCYWLYMFWTHAHVELKRTREDYATLRRVTKLLASLDAEHVFSFMHDQHFADRRIVRNFCGLIIKDMLPELPAMILAANERRQIRSFKSGSSKRSSNESDGIFTNNNSTTSSPSVSRTNVRKPTGNTSADFSAIVGDSNSQTSKSVTSSQAVFKVTASPKKVQRHHKVLMQLQQSPENLDADTRLNVRMLHVKYNNELDSLQDGSSSNSDSDQMSSFDQTNTGTDHSQSQDKTLDQIVHTLSLQHPEINSKNGSPRATAFDETRLHIPRQTKMAESSTNSDMLVSEDKIDSGHFGTDSNSASENTESAGTR